MDEREDRDRAPRNRTPTLSGEERERYTRNLVRLTGRVDAEKLANTTINQVRIDPVPNEASRLLGACGPYHCPVRTRGNVRLGLAVGPEKHT